MMLLPPSYSSATKDDVIVDDIYRDEVWENFLVLFVQGNGEQFGEFI
jgi:hypothetical protein